MLAKKYRLPIQNMYKKAGQNLKSRYFLLKIFTSEMAYSRIGVVISRKVSPKATVRNRLKRTVFDFFQKNFDHLALKDYLVIVSPAAAQTTKEKLFEDLHNSITP